jgi:hypothetical protein
MSDLSSLSSIMKWDGPKLTGGENFAEWEQYIEAISVSMDMYYLVEQEEVPHTTAVSRRRVPVTPPAPPAPAPDAAASTSVARPGTTEPNTVDAANSNANANDETDTAQQAAQALRIKHQRRFWGPLFNSLHINVVKQLSVESRNPSTFDAVKL